ncbi:MAG: NusG domain II-containing protein [Bacilli bacterium]|jgi:hypothetical protein
MNKSDYQLIFFVLFIVTLFWIIGGLLTNSSKKIALVYYEEKLIKTIPLDHQEKKEYLVQGYNGPVVIITKGDKIKVKEEESPLNLCSKQGYISKPYEMIVCLPNHLVIKIKGEKEAFDAVIR